MNWQPIEDLQKEDLNQTIWLWGKNLGDPPVRAYTYGGMSDEMLVFYEEDDYEVDLDGYTHYMRLEVPNPPEVTP